MARQHAAVRSAKGFVGGGEAHVLVVLFFHLRTEEEWRWQASNRLRLPPMLVALPHK